MINMSVSADTQTQTSYLPSDGRPDFERVVVGAADNQVAAELETRDHMIIVTFQHLQRETESEGLNDTQSMFTFQIQAAQLNQCHRVPWVLVCPPSSSCSRYGVV